MYLIKNSVPVVATFKTIASGYNNLICKQYDIYTIHYTLTLNVGDSIGIKFENAHTGCVTLVSNNSYFEGFKIK